MPLCSECTHNKTARQRVFYKEDGAARGPAGGGRAGEVTIMMVWWMYAVFAIDDWNSEQFEIIQQ